MDTSLHHNSDNPDGKPSPDLTQRISELEEQLRQREHDLAYRRMFESHNDAIIIADAVTGAFVDCNAAAETLTGYSRAELLSLRLGQLSPESERSNSETRMARLIEHGRLREERYILTKDGRSVPMDVSVQLIELDGRSYVQGAFRDMSLQQRHSQEIQSRLRELEIIYQLSSNLAQSRADWEIYDSALDGICTMLKADRASLLLADETGAMYFHAWRQLSPEYRAAMEGNRPWPTSAEAKPVVIPDVHIASNLQSYLPVIEREGIRAMILIPLLHKGELLGRFTAYFDVPRQFSQQEIHLAQMVGNHAAFAIERQRTQARLLHQQELLQKIFAQIPVMIVIYSPRTGELQLNNAFEKLTGWPVGQTTLDDLLEKCCPDLIYRQGVRDYLAAVQSEWREIRLSTSTGQIMESLWMSMIISDDTYIAIGIDLSEHKRAEEKYRAIFDTAPSGIMLIDAQGYYVEVNPAMCALLGYAREELVGRHFSLFTSEHSQTQRMALTQQISHHGYGHSEITTLNKRGETIHLEVWVTLLGKTGLALAISHDITERTVAREALRASEQRYRFLSEITSDYIFSYRRQPDGMFQVEWISDAFERITGYPTDSVATRDLWWQMIHPDDRTLVRDFMAHMDKNEKFVMEHRFMTKSGETRWLRIYGQPVWSEKEGQVVQILGAGQDVSLEKAAKQTLIEVNELLESRVQERTAQVRMLASQLTLAEQRERHRVAQILHDHLQQLLYALQFRIHIFQRDAGNHQRELLDQFRSLVDDAIRTTRTLTVDLSPPILEGEGLVEAIQWLATQMASIHHLRVHMEVINEPGVLSEEMRILLFQIVRELLFNVVKHAGVEEALVRLQTEDGRLLIVVEDHGQGFHREESAAHSDGFGLHHARERLGLFGGDLTVASPVQGGTQVTVSLPV